MLNLIPVIDSVCKAISIAATFIGDKVVPIAIKLVEKALPILDTVGKIASTLAQFLKATVNEEIYGVREKAR